MSIEAELEKLSPKDGDIIVLRAIGADPQDETAAIADPGDPFHIIQQWMVEHDLSGCLLVALSTEQDFRLLDAGQMAAHGWYPGPRAGNGVAAIAAERQRQIEVKGWTAGHDSGHVAGELVQAADAYLQAYLDADPVGGDGDRTPTTWPWAIGVWHPSSPTDTLTKAGALIAAELDRRHRAGFDRE